VEQPAAAHHNTTNLTLTRLAGFDWSAHGEDMTQAALAIVMMSGVLVSDQNQPEP
jgi:hypothetical protein